MAKFWFRQPLLDLAVVALVAVVVGGEEAAFASAPSQFAVGLASAAATLGAGWVFCVALASRLDGTPVPGFGRGFPKKAARALTRIAVQGLLLAAAAAAVGIGAHFAWSPAPLLFAPALLLTALGCVRCAQMLSPLVRVVLL